MVGTAQLAALGLWTLGIAAAVGVGLTVGSAVVKNAGCGRGEPEPEGAPHAAEVFSLVSVMPVVLEDATPTERSGGYVELLGRQRDGQEGMKSR